MNRDAQLERTRAAIARGRPAESTVGLPAASSSRDLRTIRALLDSQETGICVDCGRSHSAANRRRLIAPMRHMEAVDIAHEWSCFYGPVTSYREWQRSSGYRLLFRDLAALRASRRPDFTPQLKTRSTSR